VIQGALLVAVEPLPEVVLTCTWPSPPWSPNDLLSGAIAKAQAACPAWLTPNAVPAIINAFSRPSVDVFGWTANVTVPGPVMLTGDCKVTQPETPSTVHEHCVPVSTATVPGPPALEKDCERLERENEHVGVGWTGLDLSQAFPVSRIPKAEKTTSGAT
jgi:hypothetical protein